MPMTPTNDVVFILNDVFFEYNEEKNRANIKKHGLSFQTAARAFFDYDRIEFYDEGHSGDEDRYDIIGDLNAGGTIIGSAFDQSEDIVFVVYAERERRLKDGKSVEIIRIISARYANNFERGLYYGKRY